MRKLEQTRARLESDVKAFVERGGRIQQCDHTHNAGKYAAVKLNNHQRKSLGLEGKSRV